MELQSASGPRPVLAVPFTSYAPTCFTRAYYLKVPHYSVMRVPWTREILANGPLIIGNLFRRSEWNVPLGRLFCGESEAA